MKFTLFAFAALTAGAVSAADPLSERIDKLVEEGYAKHKVQPNAPASDETFARRIYLDVIGRIPSQEELRTFLDSAEAGKRGKLIDQLLQSEGYVSHTYNWWADILRMQTGMQNEAGMAYSDWLKTSIRDNKPYDKFVEELITAKGFIWDNGAVGYYLRDAGMPLDNMSNTTQIFLGTRVVCAQCHNHPFDRWKQSDYYKMASFTYGVETEINPRKILSLGLDSKGREERNKTLREKLNKVGPLLNDILEPLKYGVGEGMKPLKLPGDFKYAEEERIKDIMEPVKPTTIALSPDGKRMKEDSDDNHLREHYAEWVTSPQNERFAKVMANRLWKRAFGRGLVEPVDDFKDDTDAANPVLLKTITDGLVQNKFDVKKLLRSIYNTKTYQRDCTTNDIAEEESSPYYFQGPVLRRMTAEQIWDSICTLVINTPELRKNMSNYKARLNSMRAEAEKLQYFRTRPNDLIEIAEKYADMTKETDMKIGEVRKKLNDARAKKDDKAAREAQQELNKLNQEKDGLVDKARKELYERADEKTKSEFVSIFKKPEPKMTDKKEEAMQPQMTASASDFAGVGEEFYRASELPSPAPGGHFLREFGQSSRDSIEGSHTEASVAQALNLMNGPLFMKLTAENTILMKRFAAASNDEGRQNALFQTIYGRKPNDLERSICRQTVEAAKRPEAGWKDVIWALLNSREFVFVQ